MMNALDSLSSGRAASRAVVLLLCVVVAFNVCVGVLLRVGILSVSLHLGKPSLPQEFDAPNVVTNVHTRAPPSLHTSSPSLHVSPSLHASSSSSSLPVQSLHTSSSSSSLRAQSLHASSSPPLHASSPRTPPLHDRRAYSASSSFGVGHAWWRAKRDDYFRPVEYAADHLLPRHPMTRITRESVRRHIPASLSAASLSSIRGNLTADQRSALHQLCPCCREMFDDGLQGQSDPCSSWQSVVQCDIGASGALEVTGVVMDLELMDMNTNCSLYVNETSMGPLKRSLVSLYLLGHYVETGVGIPDRQFGIVGELTSSLVSGFTKLQSLALAFSSDLVGTLPSELSTELPQLTSMQLMYVALSGALAPNIISASKSLTSISIANVPNIGGQIPSDFGSPCILQTLQLRSTNITGDLSPTITQCGALQTLDLYNSTGITGRLPVDFSSRLSRLTNVMISFTQISGIFPADINLMTQLQYFDVSNTLLSGTLPHTIFQLMHLERLDLSFLPISGELTDDVVNLKSLQYLQLRFTAISGQLPCRMANLTRLAVMDLTGMAVSGRINEDITNMTTLTEVHLSHTAIQGTFPHDIHRLENLQTLALDRMYGLSGTLPASLGRMANLTQFVCSNNGVSGELPPNLRGMSQLRVFSVPGSRLSGTLPVNEIYRMPQLQALSIRQTEISGTLGDSCESPSLLVLDVAAAESISGKIPDLTNCPELFEVNIGYTMISGTISKQLLSSVAFLDAHMSMLSGSLPDFDAEVDRTQLLSLRLSHLPITGQLPPNLFSWFTAVGAVEWGGFLSPNLCDLSHTHISGTIPTQSLVANVTLRVFSVELTELSGPIPWQFGRLPNLEVLEVANNHFDSFSVPPHSGVTPIIMPPLFPRLKVLLGYHNSLSSSLPSSLFCANGNFPQLEVMALASNRLVGSVPECFGVSVPIQFLSVSRNNLTRVPPSVVAWPSTLRNLDASVNQITWNHFADGWPLMKIHSQLSTLDLSGNPLNLAFINTDGGFANPSVIQLLTSQFITSLILQNCQISSSLVRRRVIIPGHTHVMPSTISNTTSSNTTHGGSVLPSSPSPSASMWAFDSGNVLSDYCAENVGVGVANNKPVSVCIAPRLVQLDISFNPDIIGYFESSLLSLLAPSLEIYRIGGNRGMIGGVPDFGSARVIDVHSSGYLDCPPATLFHSLSLVELDVRDILWSDPSACFEYLGHVVQSSERYLTFPPLNQLTCSGWQIVTDTGSRALIRASASFLGYVNCSCDSGFFFGLDGSTQMRHASLAELRAWPVSVLRPTGEDDRARACRQCPQHLNCSDEAVRPFHIVQPGYYPLLYRAYDRARLALIEQITECRRTLIDGKKSYSSLASCLPYVPVVECHNPFACHMRFGVVGRGEDDQPPAVDIWSLHPDDAALQLILCTEGFDHRSYMCSQCQAGFYQNNLECHSCVSGWVVFFTLLSAVVFYLHYAYQHSGEISAEVGICFLYIQVMSVLQTHSGSAGTGTIGALVESILSFRPWAPECLFDGFDYVVLSDIILLLPVVLALFFVVLQRILMRNEENQGFAHPALQRFRFMLAYSFELALLPVTHRMFVAWNCDDQDDLTAAPWVSCRSSRYYVFLSLSVVCFLFYGVGVLIWSSFVLFRGPDYAPQWFEAWGFLTMPIKTTAWWWALTVARARKVLLAAVTALLPLQSAAAPVLVFVVIFSTVIIQARLQPYAVAHHNTLEELLLVLALLTYITLEVGGAGAQAIALTSYGIGACIVFFVLVRLYYVKAIDWCRRRRAAHREALHQDGMLNMPEAMDPLIE